MERKYVKLVEEFGAKIKRLRQDVSMLQIDLAGKCDVDVKTIQRLEKGKHAPSFHMLVALAEAFEQTPSQLLKGIK